jgi:hypothetical protein
MQSFQGNDAAVKWTSISLHTSLARTSYRFAYRLKESIFNFLAHPDSSLSDQCTHGYGKTEIDVECACVMG